MEPFGFSAATRRGNVHCGLNVVDQLRSGRIVRRRDQFPKSPVLADEQSVAFVEMKAADNCAIWPACQSLRALCDQPVETVRTRFPWWSPDEALEIDVVERLIVVERKAVHYSPQIAGE